MHLIKRRSLAITLLLASAAARAPAQTNPPASPANTTPPLTALVPADAVLYATWAGHSNLPPAFNDTRAKLLLDTLKLADWWDTTLPTLLPPGARSSPQAQAAIDLGKTLVTYAWENEALLYSLGPGITDDLRPAAQVAFILRFPNATLAQEAERDIQDRISQIVGAEPVPNIRFFRRGTDLAMTANDAVQRSPLDPLKTPLTDTPAFADLLKEAPPPAGTPALSVYFSVERAVALAQAEHGEDDPEFNRNIRFSGVRHAHALLLQASFDGRDYLSHAFLALDPPKDRTGFVGALTTTRPSAAADLYSAIPKSAVSVTTFSFDLPDLLARVKTEGEAVQQGFAQRAEAWIGLIGALLNTQVQPFTQNFPKDFALAALPTDVPGKYDFTLFARPVDAAKADAQLFSLAQGIQRLLLSQRPDLPPLTVSREGKLASAENALFGAAWSITDDGFLLVTLNKPTLIRALAERAAGRLSSEESFVALRNRLGAPVGASLSFANIPATFDPLLDAWRYTIDHAKKAPPPWLDLLPAPTREQWATLLAPSGSATWVTDAGLHYRSISPLPGGELLSAPFSLVAGPHSLPVTLPPLQQKLKKPAANPGN